MESGKKRKICVISGNRSDYTRLVSVMNAIEEHPDLELSLIVTASHLLKNYGETIKNILNENFKVNAVARTIIEGEDLVSMAKSIGITALEISTLLENLKPDVVLMVGDRFDIVSVPLVSAVMNIPVAHIQGGEVSGTIDESLRHAITKLSHIHFPSTEKSKERIIKMGENPRYVFNVGCPANDLLYRIDYRSREDLCRTDENYIIRINPNEKYIILMQHPVTTECEKSGEQIFTTLKAISRAGIQTIMFYPNIDAGNSSMIGMIRKAEKELDFSKIHMYKHMSYIDFMNLLKYASCIVGNSSSGIREACFFGTPAINIGSRQDGRERTENVKDVPHDENIIYESIMKCANENLRFAPSRIYGYGDAGKKIANILAEINLDNLIQKKLSY